MYSKYEDCHIKNPMSKDKNNDTVEGISIIRKQSINPLTFHSSSVPYFTSPTFEKYDNIIHGFSTRLGGKSLAPLESMNLSFSKSDTPEIVTENYNLLGNSIGFDPKRIVTSQQTHTVNIKIVDYDDCGKGYDKPRGYTDIDGLITNLPGIVLTTSYADCVPLLIFDPVKQVIGNAHSGWRGTVKKMGLKMIEKMSETYGSDPKDMIVTIGPSICQDCYEVSEEVILEFKNNFDPKFWSRMFYATIPGKYQLNLWEACKISFLEAGVKEESISLPDVCTHCNPNLLYSRRTMGENYGNFGAFLMLKEK